MALVVWFVQDRISVLMIGPSQEYNDSLFGGMHRAILDFIPFPFLFEHEDHFVNTQRPGHGILLHSLLCTGTVLPLHIDGCTIVR